MTRKIPLNAYLAHDASSTAEQEIYLVKITHPETNAVVRATTGYDEQISFEPVMYGVRSSWQGADPATDPYLFVVMSLMHPDDMADAVPTGRFAFDLPSPEMVAALESSILPAKVSIACVLASAPSVVIEEWLDLDLTEDDLNEGSITITVSREPITSQPWPATRLTRARAPGLHP
jgi:hypothetical protein